MKPIVLTGAAVLMALSTAAFAENSPTQTDRSTAATAPAATTQAATNPAATNTAVPAPGAPASGRMMDRTAVMDNANAGGMFTPVAPDEDLSSNVVGLTVYNNANENIGKIKDIAFDANGVKAYIVAVGGFLGMGDHYVAVKPSAINIQYDTNAKKWHAAMNTNADQLKAAPEYKYSSND